MARKTSVSMRLTPAAVAHLDRDAKRRGVTRTDWTEQLITREARKVAALRASEPDLVSYLSDLHHEVGEVPLVARYEADTAKGDRRVPLSLGTDPLPADHPITGHAAFGRPSRFPLCLLYARIEAKTAWNMLIGIVPPIEEASISVWLPVLSATKFYEPDDILPVDAP